MKVLGIDTTRKSANIFIFDFDNELNYMLTMNENIKHSEGIFLHIEKALSDNKIKLEDIDKYAIISGPGSFTGIRVGVSTIKGFDKVNQKGVVSLTLFEVLAKSIKEGFILTNSTINSCYYANIKNGKILDTGVVNKNDIVNLCNNKNIYVLYDEQNLIDIEYDNIRIINDLKECYYSAFKDNINNECKNIEPYYLQLSQAERNFNG